MAQEWKTTSTAFSLSPAFQSASILPLVSMYNFNFNITQRGLGGNLGCFTSKSISGLYHEFEYYAFPTSEAARHLGQLDRGGKTAKKARRAASMALRVRLWDRVGVLDKAGNPIEDGEVRFYNPLTREIQKQTMAEATRWLGGFLRPLRNDWRAKMEASDRVLDDIYLASLQTTNAEISFMEHMRRVWYLLHFTDAPVNTIHEVVWRERNTVTCKAMLDEIKGDDLASFNFRHLQALYS